MQNRHVAQAWLVLRSRSLIRAGSNHDIIWLLAFLACHIIIQPTVSWCKCFRFERHSSFLPVLPSYQALPCTARTDGVSSGAVRWKASFGRSWAFGGACIFLAWDVRRTYFSAKKPCKYAGIQQNLRMVINSTTFVTLKPWFASLSHTISPILPSEIHSQHSHLQQLLAHQRSTRWFEAKCLQPQCCISIAAKPQARCLALGRQVLGEGTHPVTVVWKAKNKNEAMKLNELVDSDSVYQRALQHSALFSGAPAWTAHLLPIAPVLSNSQLTKLQKTKISKGSSPVTRVAEQCSRQPFILSQSSTARVWPATLPGLP